MKHTFKSQKLTVNSGVIFYQCGTHWWGNQISCECLKLIVETSQNRKVELNGAESAMTFDL